MNKYVGKYRVRTKIDKENNFSENQDDTYIRGKNHSEVYRYGDNIIAIYFPSSIFANKFQKQFYKFLTPESQAYIESEQNKDDLTGEQVFYIHEKYLNEVSDFLSLETFGAKIKPRSIKNLPKDKNKYIIQDEDAYDEFSDLINDIVNKNNLPISFYNKIYTYLNDKLNLDFNKKENKLKFKQILDKENLFQEAIKLCKEMDINIVK